MVPRRPPHVPLFLLFNYFLSYVFYLHNSCFFMLSLPTAIKTTYSKTAIKTIENKISVCWNLVRGCEVLVVDVLENHLKGVLENHQ